MTAHQEWTVRRIGRAVGLWGKGATRATVKIQGWYRQRDAHLVGLWLGPDPDDEDMRELLIGFLLAEVTIRWDDGAGLRLVRRMRRREAAVVDAAERIVRRSAR